MGHLHRGEDAPGSHGHCRDDDFQDGLERGIGHGKRRLASGMEAARQEALASCSRCGFAFADNSPLGREREFRKDSREGDILTGVYQWPCLQLANSAPPGRAFSAFPRCRNRLGNQ